MNNKINLAEIPSLPVHCTAYPQGEFTTGCADIMIGKDQDGTLMRLYYPTTLCNIKDIPTDCWTRWFPGEKHSEGLARVKSPYLSCILASLLNKALKDALIPSVWEAPIVNAVLPLVLYSHGLAANRSMNNSLCNDIASYGFIVAAVEHRDQSATATLTFTQDHQENWILQKRISSLENEFEIRKSQIEIRSEECSRVLDILEKLNSGNVLTNELHSNFDLTSLKGKINFSSPILTGHSFGGATTILTLDRDKRFKIGVALDPWMFPIKDRAEQLAKSVTQPLLFVVMENFQTEKNLRYIKHFKNGTRELYTLRQGNHLHQTDVASFCCKYSTYIQKFCECYEPACGPEVILTINHALIKKFIFKNLGINHGYENASEHFLAKYDEKISRDLLSRAKTMVGWDSQDKGLLLRNWKLLSVVAVVFGSLMMLMATLLDVEL